MQLPLTISCFSKIQIGFTFLVPAHPGCHGQGAVKRVCVCVNCHWVKTTHWLIPGHRTGCTGTRGYEDPCCLRARRTEPAVAGSSCWWRLIYTPRSQPDTRGRSHHTDTERLYDNTSAQSYLLIFPVEKNKWKWKKWKNKHRFNSIRGDKNQLSDLCSRCCILSCNNSQQVVDSRNSALKIAPLTKTDILHPWNMFELYPAINTKQCSLNINRILALHFQLYFVKQKRSNIAVKIHQSCCHNITTINWLLSVNCRGNY